MSAKASRPFLFDTDFRRPRGPSPADAEALARAEAERAALEADAYARGLQAGRLRHDHGQGTGHQP
ncbi:hypothetical protein ACWKW0_16275, partial [Methylorubrum zatmanii]